MSEWLRFLEVLFIIDIIANKSPDKRRQPLLEYQVDIKVIIYGCLHSLILQYLKTCENRPRLSLCGIQRKGRSQSNTWWKWWIFFDEFFKGIMIWNLYIKNEFPRRFELVNHIWSEYFLLNKNDEGREKSNKREKHPGCVAQGHKLATLMKKRKKKDIAQQGTVYNTVYRTVFSTVYSTIYRTALSAVKWSLYPCRCYACRPCYWCLCIFCNNTFQPKNKTLANEKKDEPQKRRHIL